LSGGTILLIGGGGPMGQMHLQRAINMENGPAAILITELNQDRIDFIQSRYIEIAQQAGKQIQILDPSDPEFDLKKALIKLNGNPVADDVVVLVPTEEALTQAVSVMHADSLINIFAGTPEGLEMKVDLSLLFLGNAQFTGASGLEIEHIQAVYQSVWIDALDLNISVAAVGGMNSAAEAIRAVGERRCPGKIVIYPQVEELPLTELNNMSEVFPEVAENLGPGQVWTTEAERVLLRTAS
jgi:threonine dehydrogenase-like Zn-dependent dehydrogenase